MELVKTENDVLSELKKMNKFIYEKFEYSTTDKLKELMDVLE